jgi:hypothetical protein
MIAYDNDGPVATVGFAYPDEEDAEPSVTSYWWACLSSG